MSESRHINIRTENTEPHLSHTIIKTTVHVLTLMLSQHIQGFSQVPWGCSRWVAGREAFSVFGG